MKKLILTFVLLFGFQVYAQEFKTEKKKLNKELETELNKDYTAIDHDKVKELRKKLASLNNYIDTTKTVVYDFQKKEYTRSNVLPRVGEPLVLKIENINRLAYDVSIKSSDVAIVDEYFNDEIKTAIRATNELPEKLIPVEEKNITIPIIKNDKSDDSDKLKITAAIKTFNDAILAANKKILDLEGEIIPLEKTIAEKNILIQTDSISLSTVSNQPTKITAIRDNKLIVLQSKKDIDLKKITIKKYDLEIKNSENEINKLKSNSEVINKTFFKLKEDYSTILTQYVKIQKIETEYQHFKQMALNPLLTYESYKEKRELPDCIRKKLTAYNEEIVTFNKLISSFNATFYTAMYDYNIINNTEDEYQIEYIRSKYQQIKDEVDKINSNVEKLNLATKLLKVKTIDEILFNEKAYEILSAPIQPFEDYVTFEVKIKHRDQKRISEYDDNREFTYMEYTRGGVRFDFSTGVVFNFGGNNNEYEIKDVIVVEDGANVNKKEIVLTSKNDFTPMLAGMFHTSFRRSGMWAIGLTLGASLNVETFQLNSLFPGVSILIGKKQKFILTAGPSFRQVDVLKDNYETDTLYPIGDFSDTSQLTSKQFKIGGFFGITYNLTQKQRGKFKINGAE